MSDKSMENLLDLILKSIVKHKEDIKIEVDEGANSQDNSSTDLYPTPSYYKPRKTYIVTANEEDIPLIIGKEGRAIKSIKSILKVKAIKSGEYFDIKVVS